MMSLNLQRTKVIGCVGVLIAIGFLLRSGALQSFLSPQSVQLFISTFGMAAPVVYTILYIFLTVFFFPASVLTIIGGVLFGAVIGTMYTILAATIAATIAFKLARWFGRSFVASRVGSRLKGIESKISGDGFWSMVVLRLLFLPYIPLSYAAGLTSMKLVDFVLATFLTNIPGSLAFSYVGSSFGDPNKAIVAIMYITLVLCIPLLVNFWRRKKAKV